MAKQGKKAAVLGAGIMGSSIAAHLCNTGFDTLLLDLKENGPQPNARSLAGRQKALALTPSGFYTPELAERCHCGNFEDDLPSLAQVDLIIEAVVEDLASKQALFARVAPYLASHTILASNTSGLSVAALQASLPKTQANQFVVIHFFNPVRMLPLVEIVPGPSTAAWVVEKAQKIAEDMGKTVVIGKDTPNFIANRIGVYSLMVAMHSMDEFGLSIEQVDAILGKNSLRSSSAAFRTADLVGLDTLLHVAQNCFDHLPNDTQRQLFVPPKWLTDLVAQGALGQKSGAGCYKKDKAGILVWDIQTKNYRPQRPIDFVSLSNMAQEKTPMAKLQRLLSEDDQAAKFAWHNITATLAYASNMLGEISDSIADIDTAMCAGFAWEMGPFSLWDDLGFAAVTDKIKQQARFKLPAWVEHMCKDGIRFYSDGKAYAPMHKRYESKPLPAHRISSQNIVQKAKQAQLFDLGDGVWCLQIQSKMGVIGKQLMEDMHELRAQTISQAAGLVVANFSEHFGAGANLSEVYQEITQNRFAAVDTFIQDFQTLNQGWRYSPIPVVAAVHHSTLGGALEVAMAIGHNVALAESYMGLVEAGMGLVPAGGGCLRMLERLWQPFAQVEGLDATALLWQAAKQIGNAEVSQSAHLARKMGYLPEHSSIVLQPEQQLHAAKAQVLALIASGYQPPLAKPMVAAGYDVAQTFAMRAWAMCEGGYISRFECDLAGMVATILAGGKVMKNTPIGEQHILDLEREAFLQLCAGEKTQERIAAFLTTGKAKRN